MMCVVMCALIAMRSQWQMIWKSIMSPDNILTAVWFGLCSGLAGGEFNGLLGKHRERVALRSVPFLFVFGEDKQVKFCARLDKKITVNVNTLLAGSPG